MYRAIIVDDEKLFLDYLSGWPHWSNYGIIVEKTFTGGRPALQYLETGPQIDIIFTDIKMPGMNGLEFIEEIPKNYKEHAYIVALSGFEDYALVRHAFLNGASDYILKVDVNMPEFDDAVGRIADFLKRTGERQTEGSLHANGRTQLIADIKSYIDENLSQDLGLNGIAAHFGFSPGYLSQVFSQNAGLTVMDYLIGRRIEFSKTLLLTTDKSVTDVAYDAGFNSPEHFSRTFRKITGMSPREFRNAVSG